MSSPTLSTTTFKAQLSTWGLTAQSNKLKTEPKMSAQNVQNCFKSLQSDFQSTVSLLSLVSWQGFRRSEALTVPGTFTRRLPQKHCCLIYRNSSTSQPKTCLHGNLDTPFFFYEALLNPPCQLPGLSLVFKVA